MKVPFVDLKREATFFKSQLLEAASQVIDSGIYIDGPNVRKLEFDISSLLNVKHCVSVANGSDALTLILKTLSLQPHHEVICPANSFIATSWSVVAAGATPVFCDVTDDLLLDPKSFHIKVTSNTRAVIPVHLTGRVFDVSLISDFCLANNIEIVEDAAQAFGAHDSNGNYAGSFGYAAAFSLHPLKNLSVYGDGGLITTNSTELAIRLRSLRNHGLIDRNTAEVWGYNSRLDEIQAAFALQKLPLIHSLNSRYIEIAKYYNKNLDDTFTKPCIRANYRDIYHNYVVLVNPAIRDHLISEANSRGVSLAIHYPIPLHYQPCYLKSYPYVELRNAQHLASSMISLPIFPGLTEDELLHVINVLNELISSMSN